MSKLDDLDMKILAALYRDSSVSVPELSKQLSINLSVLYSRINRLKRRGVIERFTVSIDEGKLGRTEAALIGISVHPKERGDVAEALKNFSGVREIHEVTGRYDFLVAVRAGSTAEIHSLANDKIGKMDGVNGLEIFLEIRKNVPDVIF